MRHRETGKELVEPDAEERRTVAPRSPGEGKGKKGGENSPLINPTHLGRGGAAGGRSMGKSMAPIDGQIDGCSSIDPAALEKTGTGAPRRGGARRSGRGRGEGRGRGGGGGGGGVPGGARLGPASQLHRLCPPLGTRGRRWRGLDINCSWGCSWSCWHHRFHYKLAVCSPQPPRIPNFGRLV